MDSSQIVKIDYLIKGMDCPMEESLIRRKLTGVEGVVTLEFNILQRTLSVTCLGVWAESDITEALESLELGAQRIREKVQASAVPSLPTVPWRRFLAAGSFAALAEGIALLAGERNGFVFLSAIGAVLTIGFSTYQKGWIAIRNGNLNMNALMSLAVTGAFIIGHWAEAAMVMVLFHLAEVLEARSLVRAQGAIHSLLTLVPEVAWVKQSDGTWAEQPVDQVSVGSTILVKAGERIALDGLVTGGNSTVNQAPITGESLPVEKEEGDSVFAGTINELGVLFYKVVTPASESTLAHIIRAVESAQASRSNTERFIDRFAHIWTPCVLLVALVVAVVPPLLGMGVWMDWIYRGLVLLVIGCPCALVISTPVTIVSGLAQAAHHGILVRGGAALERGRNVRCLVFDKTGTITEGRPVLTDSISWHLKGEYIFTGEVVALARLSDHPISRALTQLDPNHRLVQREVTDFQQLVGRGVRGRIEGELYHLGNRRLVEELGLLQGSLRDKIYGLEKKGRSVVVIVREKQVLGIYGVMDEVREESAWAMKELHAMGVRTMMLTGDNKHTARVIAKEVGIDRVKSNLLPEQKLKEVEALLAPNQTIGMVGDGINDAPALARADLGFAMGAAGSAAAIETADVALMDDNLLKLPIFIRLSRRTFAVLCQNVGMVLGIKGIFMALALTGAGTLWMAVFADLGACLLVIANGLRLLRDKDKDLKAFPLEQKNFP